MGVSGRIDSTRKTKGRPRKDIMSCLSLPCGPRDPGLAKKPCSAA